MLGGLITNQTIGSSRIRDEAITPPKLSHQLAGGGRIDDMFPEIRTLFGAEVTDVGALSVTGGDASCAADTGVYETGSASLAVTIATAGDESAIVTLPADVYANGEVCLRVRSDDWTKFAFMDIALYETASEGNGAHFFHLLSTSTHRYDHVGFVMTPWTADTWRTIRMIASVAGSNASTPWGDTDAHALKKVRMIRIRMKGAGAGTASMWIDRIWTETWPKAFVAVTLDGFYSGARQYIYDEFVKRGWVGSARAWSMTGAGIYPSYAHFAAAAQAGWEVGLHVDLNDTEGGGAIGAGTTLAQIASAIDWRTKEMQTAFALAGVEWRKGKHSLTFLSNAGGVNTVGEAAMLAGKGILCSRYSARDDIFGWNPGAGAGEDAYVSEPLTAHRLDSWAGVIGPYNYVEGGMTSGTYALRDDFVASGWYSYFEEARRWKLPILPYIHDVEVSNGSTIPGTNNIGTLMAADLIAYLDAHRDDFIIGTLEDLYALTRGRPGDVYMDRLGNWTNRLTGLSL